MNFLDWITSSGGEGELSAEQQHLQQVACSFGLGVGAGGIALCCAVPEAKTLAMLSGQQLDLASPMTPEVDMMILGMGKGSKTPGQQLIESCNRHAERMQQEFALIADKRSVREQKALESQLTLDNVSDDRLERQSPQRPQTPQSVNSEKPKRAQPLETSTERVAKIGKKVLPPFDVLVPAFVIPPSSRERS